MLDSKRHSNIHRLCFCERGGFGSSATDCTATPLLTPCSNRCCNIHRVSWCRSGMRFSSMECTTTPPRRASLVSCQLPTPRTPFDTLVLKGLPFICQLKSMPQCFCSFCQLEACHNAFAPTAPIMVAILFPFLHPPPLSPSPRLQNHKSLAMQAQSSCIAFWP